MHIDTWKNPLTNWTDSRLLTHIHTPRPISLTCKSLVWLWESNGTLEEPEGATVFANRSTAMHKFLYWKIRNVLILFSPFISQWGLNLDIGTFLFFFRFPFQWPGKRLKLGQSPAFRSRALCWRCEPDSSYACLAVPPGAPAGRQKGSPFRSVMGTRAVVVKQAPGGAVQGTTSNSCKEHIEAKQCGNERSSYPNMSKLVTSNLAVKWLLLIDGVETIGWFLH